MAKPTALAGSDVRHGFGALPLNQALTGSGTPVAPATSIVSYLWELLSAPAGSAATLSSTTAQNPTLNNVDTPGTYRLFLRVVDDQGTESETSKLAAPADAFVQIRAELTYGLVPLASGERGFAALANEWPEAVDSLEADSRTHRADQTDPHLTLSDDGSVSVTNSPTAAAQILKSVSASEATWVAGSTEPDATTSVKGVIQLAEAALSPTAPKAVTRDRFKLQCGPINDSLTANGWEVGHLTPQVTSPQHPCHHVWYVDEDMRLKTVDFILLDSGDSGTTYSLKIVRMTAAQYLAGNIADAIYTVGIVAGAANLPRSSPGGAVNADIAAGYYLGVLVAAGTGGAGLCCTLNCEKRW